MTDDLGNGLAIARLLGDDGTQIAGYLYLWETGDLGIKWASDDHEAAYVDRFVDAEVLARGRAVNSAKLVEFLQGLPVMTEKGAYRSRDNLF